MQQFPFAYYGYNITGCAFAPYTGRLTKNREAGIRRALIRAGFTPGWKCVNVTVSPSGYSHNTGSGMTTFQPAIVHALEE